MVLPEQFFFLFDVIETNVLRESSTSKFSHSLGQKRKCPGSRGTSVLPSGADIVSLPRHVRWVRSGNRLDALVEAAVNLTMRWSKLP
jgi:hypothetical protein